MMLKALFVPPRTTVHFDSIYFLIVAMLRYHEDIVVVYINNHGQDDLF